MAVDYSALLYDPVYAELGVAATLDAGTAGEAAITVIDDTRPKILPAGSAEVRSVGPGAFARIPELVANGIARDDYTDAVLTFNGRSWTVRSYELRGSPNGEDLGEVRFLLKAVVAVVPPPDGNVPEWVPANAVIHIDLVRAFNALDAAWTAADGIVAVDTLLGEDVDASWYSETEYDAANLTANGYIPDNGVFPALLGAAKTNILAGSTVVIRLKQVLANPVTASVSLVLVSNDEWVSLDYITNPNTSVGVVSSLSGSINNTTTAALNLGINVLNAMACTVTSDRFDIALSGSAAVAGVLTTGSEEDYSDDLIEGHPLAAAMVTMGSGQFYAIQSITLYDALPSTAGLSELSEMPS